MIIKYKEFLNESINESEEYLQLRVKLLEVLLGDYDYAHDNHQTIDTISFSRLANTDRYDPDADYIDTLEVIKNETGITNDKMLVLFSDRINILLNQTFFEFIETNYLNTSTGTLDLYIYKTCELLGLDKNHFTLGGDGWGEYMITDPSEAVIRYNYGYHRTKYGKLLLDQLKLSDDEFRNLAELGLKDDLINERWDDIIRSFSKYTNYHDTRYINIVRDIFSNINNYVIFDENRITFLSNKLALDLSNKLSVDHRGLKDKGITTDIVNSLLTNIYADWDIQTTDNEFIIYINI